MAEEIKITDYEFKECNGNLKKLSSIWSEVPRVSVKTISVSRGYTAERLKGCLDKTNQVSKSMQLLLDNSVSFFENLGISFHDADIFVAHNIESLTK